MSRCHLLDNKQLKANKPLRFGWLRLVFFLTWVLLGCLSYAESDTPVISAERLNALNIASEAGSVSAMVELAGHHLSGSAGRRDPAVAELLYRRAAALGDPDAIFHLGNMYLLGDGVPKDEEQALRLFEKAANQGHPLATQNYESLRAILEPDPIVDEPITSKRAITADEARAMALAKSHGIKLVFNGIAVPTRDDALEEQIEEPSPQPEQTIPLADEGASALEDGSAQDDFIAAEKFYLGEAGIKDDARAITLYRKAARNGHPQAIERLLEIYETAGLPPPRCGNVGVDDEICF